MNITTEINALRTAVHTWRQQGLRVAFVPTMGALHEGHLSLVRFAQARADRVVVSIFVNPLQFGPSEDLSRYPRDLEADAHKLQNIRADLLFTPTVEVLYPESFQTKVSVARVSEGLCGAFRPGHFDGVATVVLKLFQLVMPDVAVFGEKDFQQLLVIQTMVRDLNLPIEVIGAPLLREADGLAMSSRNVFLSASERQQALALSRALFAARDVCVAGERNSEVLLHTANTVLAKAGLQVEYLEVRSEVDLTPVHTVTERARMLLAAHVGRTRLIDNLSLTDSAANA